MHKEAYFTPQNINRKSQEFYQTALQYCKKKVWELSSTDAGILVVDMQDYFLSPQARAFIPSSPAVLNKIQEFLDACRNYDIPIIYTRHLNNKTNAKMMGKWWDDSIERSNPLSQIHSGLNTQNSLIIQKSQYDAFYKTSLEKILREIKIQSLIICGVMTNLCCETTVRSAFVRGFRPFLPIDLTAAYNEKFHLSTIINLAYGFSVPVLSAQLLKELKS